MKKTIYLYLCLVFVGLLSSCENALDTKTDNSYGDEITWKLPDYALGVLNQAYFNIPSTPNSWSSDFLDVATDNAICNNRTSDLYNYGQGGISAYSNPFDNWTLAYKQIQYVNIFMERGLTGSINYNIANDALNKAIRLRSKGEAYFLRAWWELDLLQRFGGISTDGEALGYTIITKSLTDANKDSVAQLPRNNYEACVLQIIADCDSAIAYLPLAYTGADANLGTTQEGRASGKAAYALKSRVALFAASPAYQPISAYAISTDSVSKKWTRAALFAQKAITTGALGSYSALTEAMYVGTGVQGATNAEFLFRKWFNNNTIEKANFPPMFYGLARTNPSQNLIDAYPLKNGFPIADSRSGYDPQNPYIERDNRFDLTVFYNQKYFNTQRLLEIFVTEQGNKGRDVAGYDYQNTATGYYLKKFMSPKKDMLYAGVVGAQSDFHQYPLLRRAEVYFNLAEALNELVGPKGLAPGSTLSAYDIIKDIRNKNGITSTTYLDEVAVLGKDAFRALILNERRLEFAFENQRFFDLRRQKLPLNEAIRGVQITKTATSFVYVGTNPNAAGVIIENRKLNDDKFYYTPIPYNEMVKHPNFVQNKGW